MRIAVATSFRGVSEHFGHADQFLLFDCQGGEIVAERVLPSPGHQPGMLPRFLKEAGVNVVIAGGMGQRAIDLFDMFGIETVTGASGLARATAEAYLKGALVSSGSVCQHHGEHGCSHD